MPSQSVSPFSIDNFIAWHSNKTLIFAISIKSFLVKSFTKNPLCSSALTKPSLANLFNVSLIGVLSAWFAGLILDLMTGGLMGENAMILSIISYISYRFRFQIRVYPTWQIMVVVLLLLSLGELLSLWIQGVSGTMNPSIVDWINISIAVIIWPLFMGFIQKMESVFLD